MLPCCCNISVGSLVIFVDSQLYLNKWQDPRSGQPCNQWKYLLLVILIYLIKQFCHSIISTGTACLVKYLYIFNCYMYIVQIFEQNLRLINKCLPVIFLPLHSDTCNIIVFFYKLIPFEVDCATHLL